MVLRIYKYRMLDVFTSLLRTSLNMAVIIFAINAGGQTTISGTIKNTRKAPLEGVNIRIEQTYIGCISDSLGNYSLTTHLQGRQILVFSALGHKEEQKAVELAGSALHVEIILREEVSELKAVVITAGSFEASDKKRGTILKPLDIVSTASAEGDINGAMRSLPGVQQIGESGELFVRGGTGKETKVFIDGMTVNTPNYSGVQNVGLTQRNRFSPFLFKGTIFSSGGFSALYGNAMSAALIMETNDLATKPEIALGVSNTGISLGYQTLSKNNKYSSGVTLDYSNLNPMFNLLNTAGIRFSKAPLNYGIEGNFRLKTRNGGLVKLYVLAGSGTMASVKPHIIDPNALEFFSVTNNNLYTNLTFKNKFKSNWSLYTGVSVGLNTERIEIDSLHNNNSTEKIPIKQKTNLIQGKFIFTKDLQGLSAIRFGAELLKGNDYYRVSGYFQDIQNDLLSAFFTEADIYLSVNIAAKIGQRLEYSTLLKKFNYAPRISLAYKLSDKNQLSFAYGFFFQKPGTEYFSQNRNLNFTKATHLLANFQHRTNKQVLRAELFYKKYQRLIKTEPVISNKGSGYGAGMEIFWRDQKTFKGTDYWISYSYINTKRFFLNYPRPVQPAFAASHSATLVYKHMVNAFKTNVGISYAYASGRPYENPNLSSEKFMMERTLDYHSLSVSANYLTTINKTFMVVVASLSNVLGNKQIFGYNYLGYQTNNVFERAPIVPPVKRFAFVGVFVNIGVDRRQSIINNF